jgi:hypothetical protein
MYCPSCGNEILETSKFCMHCGSAVLTPTVPTIESWPELLQWDFKEYAYTWSHDQTWYNSSQYNDDHVRKDVWLSYQSKIGEQLQICYDEGWEPIGEVGPSCIRLNYFSKWNAAGAIVFTILTAGLGIILAPFIRTQVTEPTEFKLRMRRVVGKDQGERKNSEKLYQKSNLVQGMSKGETSDLKQSYTDQERAATKSPTDLRKTKPNYILQVVVLLGLILFLIFLIQQRFWIDPSMLR